MTSPPTRYRVLSILGRGGMGEVYLADDTALGRQVALKFLPEVLERDAQARARFQREARSAAALDHPFICKIFEVTESDGRPCIAMEYVIGETLEARLRLEALPMREVIRIGTEVAEALEEAHAHGIVHRDLKPANVMLTAQGHVKVMDFGLATRSGTAGSGERTPSDRLTVSGTWIGTPAYMSPEQVRGEAVDQRSDIFSFGTLMYELLVGEHPFRRATPVQTMNAVLEHEPPVGTGRLAELPDPVRLALRKMLAKPVADRYQSLAEARTDIGELSNITPPSPRPLPAVDDATPQPVPHRRATFIGREPELAELHQALDRLALGQGSVVLIGGEPGVGKTRLTEQLVADARARGCLTFIGHCYETEGTPSYIPFVEMLERAARLVPGAAFREALGDAAPEVARLMPELRRMFDDIPAPVDLPPDQQRRYLFNAYQEFMGRAIRVMPIVNVLEDLHWADEPTLLLLRHLAQQIETIPYLVIGTYRDVELDVARPFAKILEGLVRERQATRIPLRRLAEDQVKTLLSALGGQAAPAALARTVYRETEGNPFFVEEVFQHLSEEGRLFDDAGRWRTDLRMEDLQVPEGVRLVIGRRLERVGEETQRVLTIAAVIGRNFDLRVLEAAAPDIDGDRMLDALDEAEKARLVSSAASRRAVRYSFAHELIRQTLADSLSLPRRQRLHLRVAEAIEQVHQTDIDKHASHVAHHLYQSGLAADPDKTMRFLRLAADQAMAASGFEEALGHIAAALAMEEAPAGVEQAGLLLQRGRALRGLGRRAEALAAWEQALPLFEKAGAAEQVTQVCIDMQYALTFEADYVRMVEVCEHGLRAIGDRDTPERCRLAGAAGFSRGLVGDHDAGRALLDDATAVARRLGDRRLLGEMLGFESRFHYYYGRLFEQVAVAERSVAELRAAQAPWPMLGVGATAALAYWLLGRPADVFRVEGELRPTVERLGHHVGSWVLDVSRNAGELMRDGDLEHFEYETRNGLARWTRAGALQWFHDWAVGSASLARGRFPEARELLASSARTCWSPFVGLPAGTLLVATAYAGRRDEALGLWRDHRAMVPSPDHPAHLGPWAFAIQAVEALALLGERDAAHRLYPAVVTAGAIGVKVTLLASTACAAGIGAACGGQWDAAQTHFETAVAEAAESPHRLAQPDIRRWYARMLLDRDGAGDRDRARTLLGEAEELYRAIGMPRHRELAEQMIADIP